MTNIEVKFTGPDSEQRNMVYAIVKESGNYHYEYLLDRSIRITDAMKSMGFKIVCSTNHAGEQFWRP